MVYELGKGKPVGLSNRVKMYYNSKIHLKYKMDFGNYLRFFAQNAFVEAKPHMLVALNTRT